MLTSEYCVKVVRVAKKSKDQMMSRLNHKRQSTSRRQYRVRKTIHGTAQRPRLSVFISSRHISAQLIDDDMGKTLVAVTTVGRQTEGTMTEKASWAGEQLAQAATKAKYKQAVLDRGPKLYHGRISAFAQAARDNGLEF